MFVYVQSLLIILLEVLCCKIFFESFEEKRNENNMIRNSGILFALLFCIYFIAILLSNNFILKEILIIFVTTIFMYILFQIRMIKSFLLSILFQGVLLVVDYLTLLLMLSFFNSPTNIEKTYAVEGVLIIILARVVLFLCVVFIKQSIGKKTSPILSDAEWLKFIFFPIFSICTIMAMISGLEGIKNQHTEEIFFVIAFGLSGMNIVVFYLIHDILKREEKIRENEIFKMKVKNQTKMYHSISENFEKQRKKTHEFKNQILCIDSLLSSKKYDELVEYVGSVGGKLSQELDSINTNNVIVNAIVNVKYQEAIEKDILFVLKVNDLSQIRISDEDVVVILSNLLNNAIEACEKCKDEKVLKMKFVRENNMIILSVKNTYEGEIVYSEGKLPTTKDKGEEEHGIGIDNIINTVKKYNGSYIIKSENQEFYFSIIIPE